MKNLFPKNILKLIWMMGLRYWYFYFLGLLFLIITHYIQSELPFMAKEVAEYSGLVNYSLIRDFILMAIGIVVFRSASRLLFFYPARVIQKDLRVELLGLLEKYSPFRYKSFTDGQMFQILTEDMEQVRALLGFVILQLSNLIIALFVLTPKIYLFEKQLLFALIPMFAACFCFIVVVYFNKSNYGKMSEFLGRMQGHIMESFIGKTTIKNFHSEKSFIKIFNNQSKDNLKVFLKADNFIVFFYPLIPFGAGLSLIWGAMIIRELDLGSSSLILFSGFIFLFLEPLMFVSWIGIVYSSSLASWERIMKLVNTVKSKSKEELKLEENKDSKTLVCDLWGNSISYKLKKSSWSVFVGETGVGKTTILTNLAQHLKNHNLSVSYVFQAPYLYNDTVESNLFLGRVINDSDRSRARELLKLFSLDNITDHFERILELEVGENGKRLSGGQAKRLCLVRSILAGSDYILWDDPFSSVDLILEKEIVEKLRKIKELHGKHIIMTSHRISTVRACDEVIYLEKEDGIIEHGSVLELLNNTEGKIYEYFKGQMV